MQDNNGKEIFSRISGKITKAKERVVNGSHGMKKVGRAKEKEMERAKAKEKGGGEGGSREAGGLLLRGLESPALKPQITPSFPIVFTLNGRNQSPARSLPSPSAKKERREPTPRLVPPHPGLAPPQATLISPRPGPDFVHLSFPIRIIICL